MNTTEEIRKLVEKKIKEKGLKFEKVSLLLGHGKPYMQRFIRYGVPAVLPEKDRKILSGLLEISEQELVSYDLTSGFSPSSAIVSAINYLKKEKAPQKQDIDDKDVVNIMISDAVACCGNGVECLRENIIGYYQMPLKKFHNLTTADPDKVFIIDIIGDSMEPTLFAGDLVIVDTSKNYPSSDGLYVLRSGTELLVKRIQINPLDQSAAIISDNPKYKPIAAQNFSLISVIGKVIYHHHITKYA